MNRTTRLIGLGLLVATCAAAIAAMDPITLKYTPKVGDDRKYKLTGQLQIMGQDATIGADFEYKVTKVDTDGNYTLVSNQTNMSAEVAGQTINPPDTSITTVVKPNGDIVDIQSDITDANVWRLSELKHFVYPDKPVSVGDEWTSTVTADAQKGIVAATANYKFDSLEKIGAHDTAKIKVTYKETEGTDPASSDGFVWIDTTDGTMVKTQTTWTNSPSPQGPISATITVDRVD